MTMVRLLGRRGLGFVEGFLRSGWADRYRFVPIKLLTKAGEELQPGFGARRRESCRSYTCLSQIWDVAALDKETGGWRVAWIRWFDGLACRGASGAELFRSRRGGVGYGGGGAVGVVLQQMF